MGFSPWNFEGFFKRPPKAFNLRQVLRSAASKVQEPVGLSGLAPGLEGGGGAFFVG